MGDAHRGWLPRPRWEVGQSSLLRLAFPMSKSARHWEGPGFPAPTPMLTLGGLASSRHQWEQQEEENCGGESCEGSGPSWRRRVVGDPYLGTLGGGRPVPEKIRKITSRWVLACIWLPLVDTLWRPQHLGEDSFYILC